MNDSELTMRIPRLYKRFHRKLMKYIEQASVTEENLLINEYLRAENLILKQMCRIRFGKIRLSREEKICLAKKAIKFQKWHTNKISLLSPGQIVKYSNAQTAQTHISLGPTKTPKKRMTALMYQQKILEIIDEHPTWGKRQILAELRKDFPTIDRIFVGELLYKMGFWDVRKKRAGIYWKDWLKKHEGVTWGGDFFSVYVWTDHALVKYDILFFIHLKTLRVVIAGISADATEQWLINILKSWTDGFCPLGKDAKFLIRDRDRRYTKEVDWYLASNGLSPIKIAPGAPVMNCVSEQFVNNIRRDCLSHCVFTSEEGLRMVIHQYVDYYHKYRPHKKHNGGFIMPKEIPMSMTGEIKQEVLLPGLLTTYFRE